MFYATLIGLKQWQPSAASRLTGAVFTTVLNVNAYSGLIFKANAHRFNGLVDAGSKPKF